MSIHLEEQFAATIDELDLPDVDLVAAVVTAVVEPPAGVRRPRRLAIAAAIVVAVVALTLAVEPAREAVADWLGLGSTRGEIVPTGELSDGLPANAETEPGAPAAGDAADDQSAPEVSNHSEVRNPIPELGPPTAVADVSVARGRRFTWPAGAGLAPLAGSDVGAILSVRVAEGELDLKRLLGDPELEFLTIALDGAELPALWIGSEHEYVAAGTDDPVLADRVLIWVVDGLQYRLEADLPLDEMTALAGATEEGTDLLRPG